MQNVWVVLVFLFHLYLPETKVEVLKFEIQRGKKVAGELVAKKVTRGNKTIYTSYTEASITMIKKIKALYDFKVVMKNGALQQADTRVFINQKLHATSRVRLEEGKYHFQKNKKKGYLEAYIDYPIEYPAILLLFDEPENFHSSFSEEEGVFHELYRVGNHVYEKTNPKGKVNEYHYQEGVLDKAILDAGFFQFQVLRKTELP